METQLVGVAMEREEMEMGLQCCRADADAGFGPAARDRGGNGAMIANDVRIAARFACPSCEQPIEGLSRGGALLAIDPPDTGAEQVTGAALVAVPSDRNAGVPANLMQQA